MISSSRSTESDALGKAPRLPSLDGWRALCIVLVLGTHARFTAGFPPELDPWFHWLFDGNLGVRTFFFISGFLITWLMLREHDQTGRIDLWQFYGRRGWRILPVYGAFLAVVAALQCSTPYWLAPETWLSTLTFTSNFHAHGRWTVGHLWSLAVEAQFYLLWPGLLVGLGLARRSLRAPLAVLAVPVVLSPLCRVVSYQGYAPPGLGWLFSTYSSLNYFDTLAMGCACAFLHARRGEACRSWLAAKPRLWMGMALGLIAVPYGFTHCFALGIVTVPFAHTLQGCGIAVLVMQSLLCPGHGGYRLLQGPLVRRLGILSYSIYLWQQLFSTKPGAFGWGEVWWMSFPGWLVPVFLAAVASYYGLERPCFRRRAGGRPAPRSGTLTAPPVYATR
jgi:peptidoglycan/LPS O-acetylase OafA/YrhL